MKAGTHRGGQVGNVPRLRQVPHRVPEGRIILENRAQLWPRQVKNILFPAGRDPPIERLTCPWLWQQSSESFGVQWGHRTANVRFGSIAAARGLLPLTVR
jgi:hypothetical protein